MHYSMEGGRETVIDVQADIEMMNSVIGYPNSYFFPICEEMMPGLWDNVPCSEIACCISYMAGNLSKIYVSNYAQGLVNAFQAAGRFGTVPMLGAFIWFDYGDGQGPSHTGRVSAVENGVVYTVEGNVGGIVRSLSYPVGSSLIYGYGYPNYTGQQIDTYNIRSSSPAGENLPYYNTVNSGGFNTSIVGNGAVAGANVLNNCVGYAQGRLIEIHNELYPNNQITNAAGNIYGIFNANAEDWFNIAVANGYNVGNVPQYAAVGVWYSAVQNIGHVAIVEDYVNDIWHISESHYNYPGGNGSWDYSTLQANSNYLPAFIGGDTTWSLIGFIYPFTVAYPPPGAIPPTPEKPELKKKKIFMYLKRRPF